jgi:hypothetical protein
MLIFREGVAREKYVPYDSSVGAITDLSLDSKKNALKL